MTNLLPAEAKKQIVFEYWTRVVCAWVVLWSVCMFLGSALLFPTYQLLVWNNEGQQEIATAATERTNEYNALSRELTVATKQAEEIVTLASSQKLSDVLADVWSVADPNTIEINSVNLSLEANELQPFSITGEATDRQSLAQFRDALETLPFIASVDLPIENLASNVDIEFSLSVSVKQTDV